MANSIETAKKYVPLLDAVYKMASVTAQLDGDSTLVQEGANAGELIIPTLTMQGLGDYSRNDGYVKGDVTMTNETVKCNFDRGRMFQVDTMDNEETAGIAFGQLAGEFIRTKVAPELDAFRLASYCGKTGISKKQETLSDGAAVVAALRAAVTKMDEDEVPPENRHLFITPTLLGLVQDDLDAARSWSTWDMLGGGLISTAIKHGHLDDAQDGLRQVQRALSDFRTELADVGDLQVPDISIGSFATFADYFFDGIFVDWYVQSNIHDAQNGVSEVHTKVLNVLHTLEGAEDSLDLELEGLKARRSALLDSVRS